MTATDVSAVTPAEDANDLLVIAKRNLLVNNIPEAVSNLAKACELQSKQLGETAKEFAEAYYDVDYVKNVKGTNCWRRRIRKVANDNNGYNFAVSNKNNFQRECDMTFNVAAIKFSEQIIDKKVVRTNQQCFTPIFCQQCTAVQGERRSHFPIMSSPTLKSSGSSSSLPSSGLSSFSFSCSPISETLESSFVVMSLISSAQTKSSVASYMTGWSMYYASLSMALVTLKVVDMALDRVETILKAAACGNAQTVSGYVKTILAIKVSDTLCADVQERKCQTSQKPVQETVSCQQCSSTSSGQYFKFLSNLLRCQGDLAKTSLSQEISRDPFGDIKTRVVSQTVSPIPSKWRSVNERKCSDQVPRASYDTKRRQCQDVANTVCANANERKCQISQRPVQGIAVK